MLRIICPRDRLSLIHFYSIWCLRKHFNTESYIYFSPSNSQFSLFWCFPEILLFAPFLSVPFPVPASEHSCLP